MTEKIENQTIDAMIEWLSETIKKGKANYGEFDKFKKDLEITEAILSTLKDYERIKGLLQNGFVLVKEEEEQEIIDKISKLDLCKKGHCGEGFTSCTRIPSECSIYKGVANDNQH